MRDLIIFLAIVVGGGSWYYFHYRYQAQPVESDPLEYITKDYPQKDLSPTRNPEVPARAMQAYDQAKQAVWESKLSLAQDLLKESVDLKSDFTEAWYNLGATQARLAVIAAKSDDSQTAIRLFRDAVESKKKARELMIQNKWFEYVDDERVKARSDVENALQYADETLASETHLVEVLKSWGD